MIKIALMIFPSVRGWLACKERAYTRIIKRWLRCKTGHRSAAILPKEFHQIIYNILQILTNDHTDL